MLEKIEEAFRALISCLQAAQLYSTKHPLFAKTLDKSFLVLSSVLEESNEFAIGIVGEELVYGKDIFFDLSKTVQPAIMYLKARGIEKMALSRGLTREDLEKFIIFLAAPKEETEASAQERLLLAGVRNVKVGKIKEETPEESSSSRRIDKYLKLYDTSMEKTLSTVKDVLDAKNVDHLALQFTINNLMENLNKLPQEFLKLVALKRHDVTTYAHLLNVSILAMYFASKLGFTKEDVLDIGISGLFHDIGKLYISRKILEKPETLTEEEFNAVKSHTLLGAEILLNYQASFGILPVVVSFEHHLKYDLSGYPKFAHLKKPHLASLIVSICDVYDALYQRRGYKVDYSPDVIYNVMNREKGTTFEPGLLDRFFKIVGVWPIGSIVALSDGRIAVVRDQNEQDIFLPKIEVISPVDKKCNLDLRHDSSGVKIERFLSPWKEGKEFLKLV